jgi:hypothetical protein
MLLMLCCASIPQLVFDSKKYFLITLAKGALAQKQD